MVWKMYSFCVALLFLENYSDAQFTNNDNTDNFEDTDNFEELEIEDGIIRGTKEHTSEEGTPYYCFRGIPYAAPPVDNLRFEPPQKNHKWTGVLDATRDISQCVQGITEVVGSEDCLHINVYTPNLQGNLSVMVWIYGGIFIRGNSSYERFPPDLFLDRNVIFVSFNYRLGIFGFLSTEDLAAPGNNGLKDQQFALQWVQRNIKYFGGDPKKVTLFGESAGAASVSYQLQSKKSEGLFRNAIMQSGNSLCLWALNRRAKEIAFSTGLAVGIITTNSTELVDGLKKIDYRILNQVSITAAAAITLTNPLAGILFSPVKEPCHEGAFFCNRSDDLLKSGEYIKVPTIIGVNSNEASVAGDLPGILRLYTVKYDIQFFSLAPADLTRNVLNKASAGFDVKLHYFGLLSMALQQDAIIKFVSDDQFNRPTRRTVTNMVNYSSVYFYVFSHKGVLGNGATDGSPGVGHAEDLEYIFTRSKDPGSIEDQIVRSNFVTLWTNFAKYGDPTPQNDSYLQDFQWLPANNDTNNLTFLNISVNLHNEVNPFDKNMKFYDTIYESYGSGSYDTY